jgi:hypothetical protein
MAVYFFEHDATPYSFDTKLLKLCRMEGDQAVEVDNPETVWNVRLSSVEISREHALRMAKGGMSDNLTA